MKNNIPKNNFQRILLDCYRRKNAPILDYKNILFEKLLLAFVLICVGIFTFIMFEQQKAEEEKKHREFLVEQERKHREFLVEQERKYQENFVKQQHNNRMILAIFERKLEIFTAFSKVLYHYENFAITKIASIEQKYNEKKLKEQLKDIKNLLDKSLEDLELVLASNHLFLEEKDNKKYIDLFNQLGFIEDTTSEINKLENALKNIEKLKKILRNHKKMFNYQK